jgi:hypothetical protein
MKLKQNESYLWLLPLVWAALGVAVLIITRATGDLEWGVLGVPAVIVMLTLYEIWSGVALDSYWRASHARGTGSYYGLIAWQLFIAAAFMVGWLVIE